MATEANSQDSRFNPDNINGEGTFHEHTEHMGVFYETHTGDNGISNTGVNGEAYQARVRTCRVALTVSETGGSATSGDTTDWISLVPMWRMAQRRFSPN